MIESDNTAAAVAEEVTRNSVERLVIGGSSRSFFSRYITIVLLALNLLVSWRLVPMNEF